MTENKIWIELAYVLAGIIIALAIHANLPKKSHGHPTLYAAPCDCMAA